MWQVVFGKESELRGAAKTHSVRNTLNKYNEEMNWMFDEDLGTNISLVEAKVHAMQCELEKDVDCRQLNGKHFTVRLGVSLQHFLFEKKLLRLHIMLKTPIVVYRECLNQNKVNA
jgi:hypothetical protein